MNLRTYIQNQGEAAVAAQFNVSLHTVRKWRTGDRKPRPEKANEIVTKTGGEVTLAGIYAQQQKLHS